MSRVIGLAYATAGALVVVGLAVAHAAVRGIRGWRWE